MEDSDREENNDDNFKSNDYEPVSCFKDAYNNSQIFKLMKEYNR